MPAVAPVVTLTTRFGSSISETSGSGFIDVALSGGTYTSVTSRVWSIEAGGTAVSRVLDFRGSGFIALQNIAVNTPATIRLTVVVQDRDGSTATSFGDADFVVTAVDSPPNVRIDTPSQTINGRDVLQLQATDSDPGGFVATRQWKATLLGTPDVVVDGFSNSAVQDPRWTAPDVESESQFNLTISVEDDDGRRSSASVLITVRVGNPMPDGPLVVSAELGLSLIHI